ncbi:BglG family transcription antiterminator [Proteiniclasticum sp.]|uniref:BglG family transcription antiterminator n=1 Tax=Proteiniclasticum sp. TaxID=2053595 RepID=UPI0028A1D56A|nr:BglG family transcription antiterminator [Proteiniclasticum sp.]
MELNNDCILILSYISEYDDEYVKLSELSDHFNVTEKTIRNRLNQMEDFLRTKGFDSIDRKYGQGIRLKNSHELKAYLKKFTTTFTPYQYVFSPEERKRFIQSELLQSQEPINISYFMSIMDISKNTVIKVLNEIEDFFGEYALKLVRKPRVGVFVVGEENNKRIALSRVNSEIMSVSDILNYISTGKGNSKSNILQFETLFSEIDIDFLDRLVREVEEAGSLEFSDAAYGSMITHLVIMIKRIQMDKHILVIDAAIDEKSYAHEIRIAQMMVDKIEAHYGINIPESEVNYIVLHLIGAKLNKGPGYGDYEKDGLRQTVLKMIRAFESLYNITFRQPDALLDGLLLHLRPAVNRIRFNLSIENPLYDDILIQYRELFENTRKICVVLEEYLGKNISLHEISYIMLHFGAAIQNSIEEDQPHRVVLVCGTGIGTANMLKSQLNEVYHIDVVDTISARIAPEYPASKYDFVISTISIPGMEQSEYIRINPLLMKSDFEKLDRKLSKKKNILHRNQPVSIDGIMNIIEKYADIKNYDQLQLEIMMILADKITEGRTEGGNLRDYLKESNIRVSVPVKNWEDTVEEGCRILEQRGSVLPRYADSIREKLNSLGPYMVIAPGIVLLHTDIKEGVQHTDFSLMTLRQGIRFGKQDFDPVRLVITFSTSDGVNHIQALRDLAILLSDQEKILRIMNAESKKEIQKLL